MAAEDVKDIQLKLHSKYQLFNSNASTKIHDGVNLLATASTFGLVIVGRPSSTEKEIEVLQLRDVVEMKESEIVPYRSIKLSGEPYSIALNFDHTQLSVCYTLNDQTFMDIFIVQTFLSINVQRAVSKIMVSNDPNVNVKQILWNPVIGNTMVLCLSDGTLGAYVIKDNNEVEYNSIDKSENARCACWSPNGKQIVIAFPNGKLAQYKPDLKSTKTIISTLSLFPGTFSPIAVQWLSTYQFAVVFVEEKSNTAQSLFIVNAPENVQPTYINCYDINYSQSGPRAPQVFLIHIPQWNLILMGWSNGNKIDALRSDGNGETPLWTQYTFLDEARAELPLTADKQDTFPIGLSLETGTTHKLVIGENEIPVMPMLHILSTHGFLLSFDLLNSQPPRVNICSPPRNITDQSGLRQFEMRDIDSKPSDVTLPTFSSIPGNIKFLASEELISPQLKDEILKQIQKLSQQQQQQIIEIMNVVIAEIKTEISDMKSEIRSDTKAMLADFKEEMSKAIPPVYRIYDVDSWKINNIRDQLSVFGPWLPILCILLVFGIALLLHKIFS